MKLIIIIIDHECVLISKKYNYMQLLRNRCCWVSPFPDPIYIIIIIWYCMYNIIMLLSFKSLCCACIYHTIASLELNSKVIWVQYLQCGSNSLILLCTLPRLYKPGVVLPAEEVDNNYDSVYLLYILHAWCSYAYSRDMHDIMNFIVARSSAVPTCNFGVYDCTLMHACFTALKWFKIFPRVTLLWTICAPFGNTIAS